MPEQERIHNLDSFEIEGKAFKIGDKVEVSYTDPKTKQTETQQGIIFSINGLDPDDEIQIKLGNNSYIHLPKQIITGINIIE